MEEVKVRELPETDTVEPSDYMIIEDEDGTKKSLVKNFRSLLLVSLFFDSIQDLKESPKGLKEGDICMTLGYYKPGDGGGALYRITYNPAAVEDRMLVHYLSYSDTLRAEMIIDKEFINVNQFGAKGDGKTDDTNAIQGAFDHCSKTKIIKFNKNSTYVIRKSIEINHDNTIVDGNSAILHPHYCDGFIIRPVDEVSEDKVLYRTILKNLIFDLDKTNAAIYIKNAKFTTIKDCTFKNISDRGIYMKNNREAKIENCHFEGMNNTNSTAITIDGDDTVLYDYIKDRKVTIEDCLMYVTRGIYFLSKLDPGSEVLNIDKVWYSGKSQAGTTKYGIYLAEQFDSIHINGFYSTGADTVLYAGGAVAGGQIICNGIMSEASSHIFDIETNDITLSIMGNVGTTSGKMFKTMSSKLLSNIPWGPIKPTFDNFIGELCDSIMPYQYDKTGYSISGSALTLKEARNMFVDWSSSTENLNAISGGVKGQLMYLISSTNKSVVAVTNKIVLSAATIQLGYYKGILLKYDGLKWIQIQ